MKYPTRIYYTDHRGAPHLKWSTMIFRAPGEILPQRLYSKMPNRTEQRQQLHLTAARLAATVVALLLFSSIAQGQAAACKGYGKTADSCLAELAQDIVDTLKRGDGPGFTALVDSELLAFRALWEVHGTDLQRTRWKAQLTDSLAQVGENVIRDIGPSSRPAFVGKPRYFGVVCKALLVRLEQGEQGLRYIDFYACVDRGADAWRWTVIDWYDYAHGQTYSEALRLGLALVLPDQTTLYWKYFGLLAPGVPEVEKLRRLGQYSFQGDWDGWLEVYGTLPEVARKSRALLIGRMSAAKAVGNRQELLGALEALESHHGDDASLSLFLLDYYLLQGDFQVAQLAVDRLERVTGDAPAMADLRARIALHRGDAVAATTYARQAINEDPDLEGPYWNLLRAGALARDYPAAMEGVAGLRERFGYELSATDLMARGDFRGLVESEVWQTGY